MSRPREPLANPGRTEYERIVLDSVRRSLLDPRRQETRLESGGLGESVRVESVELDESKPEHEVVVTLRDTRQSERLLEWRMEAVESDVLDRLTSTHLLQNAAEIHATIVWANFEESLVGSPHSAFREVPEKGSPQGS